MTILLSILFFPAFLIGNADDGVHIGQSRAALQAVLAKQMNLIAEPVTTQDLAVYADQSPDKNGILKYKNLTLGSLIGEAIIIIRDERVAYFWWQRTVPRSSGDGLYQKLVRYYRTVYGRPSDSMLNKSIPSSMTTFRSHLEDVRVSLRQVGNQYKATMLSVAKTSLQ